MTEFETEYLAHHGIKGFDSSIYTEPLENATEFLAHYQIKGAKHGIRRFQNYDGSLTPEGRIRYGVGEPRKSKSETKTKNTNLIKKAIDKHKRRKEADEIDGREMLKNYLRKHPKKMASYGKALTKEEADEVISKIQFDRKLKSIRDEEVAAGWKKLQNASNNVNTLYNLINNSKNLYNIAAEIHNALIDSGHSHGKKWVRVGGKNTNQNNNNDNN